jgi:hypothetical protein
VSLSLFEIQGKGSRKRNFFSAPCWMPSSGGSN